MKALKMMALGGCIATLAACQTTLEQYASMPAPTAGTPFTQALHAQYRTFASDEWRARGAFGTLEYYAAKGMRAHAGQAVPPEDLGTWGPDMRVADELARERARLVRVLPSASQSKPQDAAIAQRAFDCWLTRASTVVLGGNPWPPAAPSGHYQQMLGTASNAPLISCKEEYLAAMARIEGPQAPAAGAYTVFFDTNRFNLDAAARGVIREAVAAIRSRPGVGVAVVGHADTVGRPGPNQTLSERRANEVRRALLAEGVQAQIATQGRGETDLAVATPDNTNERRNRRAVIVLQ